ncbi:MAG: amidase [Acidimicrobiales bacterium]
MDPYASATELAIAIRARRLSPVELLDSCLDRVDRLDPALRAVIWRNDDEARGQARAMADAIAGGREDLGPFAGVPIPVKDLTPVAGWPLTYGSYAAPAGVGTEDELVVVALRRAGFILTGRTNTPEFGTIPATENVRYGITRNPWDLSRTPGGSSGGAAAAVASGMFPIAHGSDGGGSIRIPASCTGLVGLKSARGRVPAIVPGWLGASVEGVLARTVADAAGALDAVSGPDPLCWYNAPAPRRPFVDELGADPKGLRVALLTRAPLGVPVHETARDGVHRAGSLLERLGHHVEEVDFELFPVEVLASFLPLMNAAFGDYDGIDVTRMEPHNAASYQAGQAVDSLALVRGNSQLQRISREISSRWGREFDVLVTPTTAIPAPPAGAILRQVHEDPGGMPMDVLSMAIFTAPFNVSGQPAVSLPLHQGEGGIPVGVQLVAGPWQEHLLIRVASQLEEADPWRDRRPPLEDR